MKCGPYKTIDRYQKCLLALVLLAVGIAFYLMCASNPLRWDDLMYQYVWFDHKVPGLLHPVDLSNRVDNLSEAFVSQVNHYKVMNGRFIVHFITQCFCGFIGKGPFNVVNTLVYLFLMVAALRLTRAHSLIKAIGVIAALWLLLPVQWILSFDVVFPINYLWTAAAIVTFVLLFRHVKAKAMDAPWKNALLMLLAVVCGSMHEGFSLPLSGALFCYVLLRFRHINASQWCLVLGMWMGTLIVIGSPGIWNRAAGASAETLGEVLSRKADILRYSKRLYLLVALLVAGWFLDRQKTKAFLHDSLLELTFVLMGFLFLFMLPYYSQRMSFPMDLFVVLMAMKYLCGHDLRGKASLCAAVALAVLLAVHVPLTVHYAQQVGSEYHAMLKAYGQSPSGTVQPQSFTVPKLFRPYVFRLGEPSEVGLISFTMQKEMHIAPCQ